MPRRRLTPIESAIAGEPSDRRQRYEKRMRDEGGVKLTLWAHQEVADMLKLLAKASMMEDQASREAFLGMWRAMLVEVERRAAEGLSTQ